jgi:hypothetical protein
MPYKHFYKLTNIYFLRPLSIILTVAEEIQAVRMAIQLLFWLQNPA